MQLPEGFLKMIAGYGAAIFDRLPDALAEESPVSVRYNSRKTPEVSGLSDRVAWCEMGRYLAERPQFTLDPALHQGKYYVQEASSMFIWHILKQMTADGKPVRYLDACAAPGGKTTAALDALPEGSVVVANEYVAARAAVLRENVVKWGNPNYVVTQGDTSRFASICHQFDIIAADVPCSGEGMMRKDAKAVEQWSPELIGQCVRRQREIVDNLWHALRPGGCFIYSTCTFNRQENEEMVEYLCERYGAESIDIPIEDTWGIAGAVGSNVHCCRFIPGAVRGEGQFMAVVRKPEVDGARQSDAVVPNKADCHINRSCKGGRISPGKKNGHGLPQDIEKWVSLPEGASLQTDGDGTVFVELPSRWGDFPFVPRLEIATVKGRDLIPTHSLAMSTLFNADVFPSVEADRSMALDFLRCQSVNLPEGTPRGLVLLTYGGSPLGWVKNVGNRANNLYPKGWRILSQR